MGQSSTVLVTGATGFVGRHLVSALLAKGFKVRASGRNVEIARAMPWFDDVEFCTADIHAPDLDVGALTDGVERSEEHTSELQSLMRISYAVFCLKQKKNKHIDIDICLQQTH